MLRNSYLPVKVIMCVYSLTFLIIFPLLFHKRVFTLYYLSSPDKKELCVLAENEGRVKKATNYFRNLNPTTVNAYYEQLLHNEHLDIIITLVTVKRAKNHFPIQVAYQIDEQIRQNTAIKASLLICNVDNKPTTHVDAIYLSTFFPKVIKRTNQQHETYDREKDDYIFCLQKSLEFKSKYVLMLEDDSLPRKNMLPYLKYIIDNKISHFVRHGERVLNSDSYLAVKLFYPLRWSGYEFSIRKMLDLVGICFLGAGLFSLISFILSWFLKISHNLKCLYFMAVCGGLYAVICALLLQRPNFMEIFWLHPSLFRVSPAPGCCTPAVLYVKSQIQSLINFLNSTTCTKTRGLDLVIDEYAEMNNLKMYLVEPNLFQHIGFYSSLSDSKNMKTPVEEFLFD